MLLLIFPGDPQWSILTTHLLCLAAKTQDGLHVLEISPSLPTISDLCDGDLYLCMVGL